MHAHQGCEQRPVRLKLVLSRRLHAMKSRREWLLTLTALVVAVGVVITPVIAEELLGVITSIDLEGKKVTVAEKDSGKDVTVKVTDSTEIVTTKGGQGDLEKLSNALTKIKDAGKKGIPAKVTHENGVASKILVVTKKKADN
jgi:hypothetical protein